MTLNYLLLMILSNTMLMTVINSSIIMMANIIFQTILVCILIKYILLYSWMSFILFLVFVGGLMVLFIYIVSLSSNPKFLFKTHFMMIFLITVTFMIFNISTPHSLFYEVPKTMNFINPQLIMKVFSDMYVTITPLIMTYLLVALIVVVEIVLTNKSPLRSILKKM